MQHFIYTVLRKLAFGAALALVTWCFNNHVFTQAQLDKWLYALAGLIVMAGTAAWTEYILPWLKSKGVPMVQQAIASVNAPPPPTIGGPGVSGAA